jgi:hypothetical protein
MYMHIQNYTKNHKITHLAERIAGKRTTAGSGAWAGAADVRGGGGGKTGVSVVVGGEGSVGVGRDGDGEGVRQRWQLLATAAVAPDIYGGS